MKLAHDAALPLRIGSPAQFAAVVAALRDGDFTEASILRTLQLNDMSDLGSAGSSNTDLSQVDARLSVFLRLFLFFEPVALVELEPVLGRSTLDAFLALDILRAGDETGSTYHASVFLYPVADFYVTSDRPVGLDSSEVKPDDWVFPAIFEGTLGFLRLLPERAVDDALDLCSGSGIAALALSRSAGRAVAADVTARAAHYARFNRILNARNNVEVLEGDLYGAVTGRTFDCIVAHPPYVPALRDQAIYRDGGETGEHLVRRIIEGLPRHLRRGGTYLGLSLNIDTAPAPFESRVRGWLGETQREFDIAFAAGEAHTLEAIIQSIARREASLDAAGVARMRRALEHIDATRFIYGALAIRRRSPVDRDEPSTLRTTLNPGMAGRDLERLLRVPQAGAG